MITTSIETCHIDCPFTMCAYVELLSQQGIKIGGIIRETILCQLDQHVDEENMMQICLR